MKICPQCNREVNEDFRFCGECGYDFQDAGMAEQPQKFRKIRVQSHKHPVKKVKQVKIPAPVPIPSDPYETPPPPLPQTPSTSPPSIPYPEPSPYPSSTPYPEPTPYPSSTPYPEPSVTPNIDYRAKAEDDYSRGDYYGALDSYKLALMNDPGNFTLLMAKERLLEMLNHKDEAVEVLDEALKVQPENREIWKTKSRLLLLLYHEKGDHHYKKDSEAAEKMAEDLKEQLVAKGLCPSCNGAGNCLKCHGTGSCHECGGTGVYKGVVKCQFCNGTGKCDRCLGSTKCPDCKGKGKLELNECKHCGGNGLCSKCHGTGKHLIGHCKECDGTGYCPHCKGKGKIPDLPKTQES